jgi:hypothetical protein
MHTHKASNSEKYCRCANLQLNSVLLNDIGKSPGLKSLWFLATIILTRPYWTCYQQFYVTVGRCEEKHQPMNHKRRVIVVHQLWRYSKRKEKQTQNTHRQSLESIFARIKIRCWMSGACRKSQHRQFHYLSDLIWTAHSSLRRNSHTKRTMMYAWMYVHCM